MTSLSDLPSPPRIPGYSWRPVTREDLPSIHRMMEEIDRADRVEWTGSMDSLEQDFDDPCCRPDTETMASITAEGEIVALARVSAIPEPQEEAAAHILLDAHPGHRGRGLEPFLLSWAEARARQRLADSPAGLPRLIRAHTIAHKEDRIRLLEETGFAMARCFFRMRRDLGLPVPEAPRIDGIEYRAYAPQMKRAMMDAVNATFVDHWGFEPVTEDLWAHHFSGNKDFRPDLSIAAVEGERIAGYTLAYLHKEENHRLGITQAWIGLIGVVREWRRKGLATALLLRSMRMFREAGMTHAVLGVDSESLTGALGLYERVGFETVLRVLVYSRDVTGC